MSSPGKKLLLTVAKFAIPIAIIAFLLTQIDQTQWDELTAHPKNYWILTAALLVAMAAVALSFARWCVLVRCQGIDLTMLEAFRLGSICFLLSFVSAGSVGGDLFKAIFLARRRPGKRVQAVASVFVDRGVGLYGLLLLVALALLIRDPSDAFALGSQDVQDVKLDIGKIKLATAVLATAGTAVLALLVFGGRVVDRLIRRGSTLPLVGGLIHHVGPPLRMFHHHPIAFGVSIVMSLAVHLMLAISMYCVARGLYPAPPTFADHLVIVPIGMLVSALPLTPAGVGLLEATIDYLYRVIPATVTKASGTLVALVFEFVKLVLGIIGTIFYWTANEEVLHSLEVAEEEAAHHHDLTDLADDVDFDGESPETRQQ
jgi:uncharacterized membrane protein YbhN (UPF0104 family)